jgi:hypothetical protein
LSKLGNESSLKVDYFLMKYIPRTLLFGNHFADFRTKVTVVEGIYGALMPAMRCVGELGEPLALSFSLATGE